MLIKIPTSITIETLHRFAAANNCALIPDGGDYIMVPKTQNNKKLIGAYQNFTITELAIHFGIDPLLMRKKLIEIGAIDNNGVPLPQQIADGHFLSISRWERPERDGFGNASTVATSKGLSWLEWKMAKKSALDNVPILSDVAG